MLLAVVGFKQKGWGVASSSRFNRRDRVLLAAVVLNRRGGGVASSSRF